MLRLKRRAVRECHKTVDLSAGSIIDDIALRFERDDNGGKHNPEFRGFCLSLRMEFDRAIRAAAARMRKLIRKRRR